MSLEHRDEQLPKPELDAAMHHAGAGRDEFREMLVLAAAANSINDQAYRYRVGVQNCGAFKEPR